MKKFLFISLLLLALVCALVSCGDDEPIISVNEDGYVVVNGVTTEIVADKDDVITVDEDGYVIVNGVKTEYKIHTKDEISVNSEGYLIVNGVKTEYEVNDTDVVTVDNEGYLFVNGVKTDYKIEKNINDEFIWHNYVHGVCTDCGEKEKVTPGLEFLLSQDGTYYVVSGGPSGEFIYIPSEYNGLPVKHVLSYAFHDADVQGVSLPDTIESVGSYAFTSDDSVAFPVYIGKGLVNISTIGFRNCIYEVHEDNACFASIDGSLYSKDLSTLIGFGNSNDSKKSFNVPLNVRTIRSGASVSAKNIFIHENVSKIEENAIAHDDFTIIYCEAENKPNGWDDNWIADYALENSRIIWNCKNNEIAEDGYIYACVEGNFYRLKNEEATLLRQYNSDNGTITIPSSIVYNGNTYKVTVIGDSAFYHLRSELRKVEMPNTVKVIGNSAFLNCELLETVSIPDSVIEIGSKAFQSCHKLEKVIIPASVSAIGDDAFYSFYQKHLIYCEAEAKPNGWSNEWNRWNNNIVIWNCNNNDVAEDGYIYVEIDGIIYKIKDTAATVAWKSKSTYFENDVVPEYITYNGITYNVI